MGTVLLGSPFSKIGMYIECFQSVGHGFVSIFVDMFLLGLEHSNIKKTKVTNIEELYNFNINNEDVEIVKDLLTSVQPSTQMETAVKRLMREG